MSAEENTHFVNAVDALYRRAVETNQHAAAHALLTEFADTLGVLKRQHAKWLCKVVHPGAAVLKWADTRSGWHEGCCTVLNNTNHPAPDVVRVPTVVHLTPKRWFSFNDWVFLTQWVARLVKQACPVDSVVLYHITTKTRLYPSTPPGTCTNHGDRGAAEAAIATTIAEKLQVAASRVMSFQQFQRCSACRTGPTYVFAYLFDGNVTAEWDKVISNAHMIRNPVTGTVRRPHVLECYKDVWVEATVPHHPYLDPGWTAHAPTPLAVEAPLFTYC